MGSIVGKNLSRALAELAWTQAELAARAGLSPSYISRVVAGQTKPRPKNLGKIAAAFGMTVDQLAEPPPQLVGVDAAQDVDTIGLPVYATIPASPPAHVDPDREVYHVLRHLAEPGRYILRVRGDSMYPTLHDRDLVLVQGFEGAEPADVRDHVCAVVLNGEASLKRLRQTTRNGRPILSLVPDNAAAFGPIPITRTDSLQIVGIVLRVVDREVQ